MFNLKYMGSKARLPKEISPIINNLINENNVLLYIEPFVGGANMIQHINEVNIKIIGGINYNEISKKAS